MASRASGSLTSPFDPPSLPFQVLSWVMDVPFTFQPPHLPVPRPCPEVFPRWSGPPAPLFLTFLVF